MSQVKISGNASGTGVLTISAPNTNTDRSITIPDKAGAIAVGAGTIVQVVNATTNTQTSSTSTTYADTTLTASITPNSTSNKVLVLFSQAGCHKSGGNTHGRLKLLRDSTDLYEPDNYYGWVNGTSNDGVATISGCYLDSPSSSSSVTYKTQFNNGDGAGTVYVQILSGTSTITLMEVVA
jgi:hypothetical protein